MNCAVEVEGLEKSYGRRRVLGGVSFQVEQGETFALLGANGAGKTTALECVEGLKRPDGGRIAVNGRVGIQLQSSGLPAYIRPMEAVRLFACWNRAAPDPLLLEELGIPGMGKRQYQQLSTGQKRRLHLALALSGDPAILFLDEPTAGLDVAGRQALHGQIRRLKAEGKTILLASHDMAEVEALCDRVAILKGGKIAFCGPPAALTGPVGKEYYIQITTEQGTRTLKTGRVEERLPALFAELEQEGLKLLDLRVGSGSLEEHFIEFVEGEKG